MTLRTLDPATTLFIIASKTFTTQETMANAASARDWLVEAVGEGAVGRHFVAVSTNARAVQEFGIDTANMFEFRDWVGGRFSLWSAIGLSIALAVGPNLFFSLLEGAARMDDHFAQEPLERNLPVILGLLGIWNGNFLGARAHAILPYDQRLWRFPAFIQQLDMESNGKSRDLDGQEIAVPTGPVVFGEPGTNGQHAFYQLLHQGSDIVPADFILTAQPSYELGDHHTLLVANALAQSEALMRGRTTEEAAASLTGARRDVLARHKTFPGNRPSNTIVLRNLDAYALGALIALYEHKIFVQGAIWGVNSFDQWGVELGKELAQKIIPELRAGAKEGAHDSSTLGLIRHLRDLHDFNG